MKYLLNLNQAKKEGMLLAKISLVHSNYAEGFAPIDLAKIFKMDISEINTIVRCITEHPDWSDEQIYQYLYVDNN